MGTTCSIGDILFSFGTFAGEAVTVDLNNNVVVTAIDPNSIQLIPVNLGSQRGFQLLTPDFRDSPSTQALFDASHYANFTYSVVGLNGALIYSESELIVGSIENRSDVGAIEGIDIQNYFAPIFSAVTNGTISYNQLGFYNQPYSLYDFSQFGLPPQSESDPLNFGIHSVNEFAYTTQTATLVSDLMLYNTAPSVPEPGSIALFGSGVLGLAGILRRKLTL